MTVTLTDAGILGAVQIGVITIPEARELLGFKNETTEEEK